MPPKKSKDSKSSPKKGSPKKDSPKKGGKQGDAVDYSREEEEVVIPVPTRVLVHRLKFMLKDSLKADVDFILGPENNTVTIKAHKCILAAESPIFTKIFQDIEAGLFYQPEEPVGDKPESKKGSPEKKSSPKGKKGDSPKKGKKGDSPSNKKESSGKGKKESPKKDSPKKKGSPKKGEKDPAANTGEFPADLILNDKEVRVPDVHPEGFYKLLRYIYHDEIVFDSIVGAIRALHAARKYCISLLANNLIQYLENNVTIEHVIKLLRVSLDQNLDTLQTNCMNLIINETYEVIYRPEFVAEMSHRMIELFLEQDILNAREIEIYDQVMHWAENECEKAQITVNAINQRAMLRLAFNLIRFPTILPHEFATHIVPSGVLRSEEIIPILSYYVTGRIPNLPYSTKTRRRPCLRLDKFESDSVAFSDETDLTFAGFEIRRSSSAQDIFIPVGNKPPLKPVGILTRWYRTTSMPNVIEGDNELYKDVLDNIFMLKDLLDERMAYEHCKKHMILLKRHYK